MDGEMFTLWILTSLPGEGNGTLLQYSGLENPMDRGAWWAAVHGVDKSRIRLSDFLSLFTFMHWRRKWQPTPVLWPGKSHGQRSLVGYIAWGCKESDMTERLHFHFHFQGDDRRCQTNVLWNCTRVISHSLYFCFCEWAACLLPNVNTSTSALMYSPLIVQTYSFHINLLI